MGKIEKAQKELEASLEAARVAAEASLNEKMEKSEEMKNLQMEDMLKKIKEHQDHVKEVRSNQEEMLKPHVEKVQATIKAKEERARFSQHTLLTYRTPRVFGDKFGDKFVTKFGDHQIFHQVW